LATSMLLIDTKGKTATQRGGFVIEAEARPEHKISVALPVDIDTDGLILPVDWDPVAGADSAEVSSASLKVAPAARETALGTLSVASQGASKVVTIPEGRRIRYLSLANLKRGSDRLRSQAELQAIDRRLVVTVPDGSGGWSPPLFAVPPVGARNMLPQMLGGAAFANGVLTLPDLQASRVRLTLASNDSPEDFARDSGMTLGTVTGVAADYPLDLQLHDPEDTVLWSFPGEMPPGAPPAIADLRVPAETAINGRLGRGEAAAFGLRLRAGRTSSATVDFAPVRGELLRRAQGTHGFLLEGAPVVLGLPGPAPAAETPASVIADIAVRYTGERLLAEASAALPAPGAEVRGVVVDAGPVLCPLPKQAMSGQPITRLGLIGRAPVPCALSVGLVQPRTQAPIGPSVTVALGAAQTIGLVWVHLAEARAVNQPLAVAVRATSGRFFLAGEPDPLIRLVVRDPDPGGRLLTLDGEVLVAVDADNVSLPAAPLPTNPFRNAWPILDSDLFLKVDVADLTMRYRR